MEVVIAISMMIVPVISLVALALTIRNGQKVNALKSLVVDLSKVMAKPERTPNDMIDAAMQQYRINGI